MKLSLKTNEFTIFFISPPYITTSEFTQNLMKSLSVQGHLTLCCNEFKNWVGFKVLT